MFISWSQIPEPAWRGAQSAAYSFTVSVIVAGGDYVAGTKSAALAAVATLIYTLIAALFNTYYSTEKNNEMFFASLGVTYLVTEWTGVKMAHTTSVFTTFIPYALKIPTKETPLFGIIVF